MKIKVQLKSKTQMKKKITINVPAQMQTLCELLETTPESVIQSFINDLAQENASSGSDERHMAAEYFMRCGYGMHLFEYDQIDAMFSGLDDVRKAFYNYGNSRIDEYKNYRKDYLKEWSEYWKEEKKKKRF
jgi:hypothetical protein